jgi:hypothetical protein
MKIKIRRPIFVTFSLLLPLVAAASVCQAQSEVKTKVETKAPAGQKPTGQKPGSVSISAEAKPVAKEANPGVAFSKLGGEIARPPLPTPGGGATALQVSAPLGTAGSESILLNVYRRNQALFVDVLTAKGQQVGTRRATVRLIAPLPAHPENMTATLRYLEPRKRKGLMLVLSDEAMHYVLAFPKGLGPSVTQQQFLNTSKTGTQSTYSFGELDGRGFGIVKATVVSAGEIKATEGIKYFVWNGSRFIPRAYN